ncbi:MAG: hypothetical protein WCL06_16395, partial [Bacteroidota bacterium]
MKTCTPCNLSYPDEKKFCKSCGRILTPGATLHSNATVQPSLSALKTKGAKMQSAGKALKIVLI